MGVDIRTELPGDAASLERLLTRAFGQSSIAGLVAMLRDDWPSYDPTLSVVAADGERLVGHVLGLAVRARLLGEWVPAMTVGPVCVDPEYQRRGIGGAMLAEVHRRGGEARFALLAGVPSYYPRHGYVPSWCMPVCHIDPGELPPAETELVAEPVAPRDLPWLRARQEAELAEVDFGLTWPETLRSWTRTGLDAAVWYTRDGRRAGYTLAPTAGPMKPVEGLCLLAEDPDLARALLARIRPASLAHHPDGWLARSVLEAAWSRFEGLEIIAPLMARELVDGSLSAYRQALEAGRCPGTINWPLPFWLCS